jgi:hypothetical protein
MRTFAIATGQLWKYRVEQLLTVATGLETIAFFSIFQGNPAHLPEGLVEAAYFPICILWFIWSASAVRCPSCGKSPTWYQMTHGQAGNTQQRVDATTTCPSCGFNPSTPQACP